ncbi:HET-domain-containing protein [Bimuria novae-zelandiae CBS 107.79]|uniref:HET-domain-containing protein n=1 Tax=Bimuria novae-zelandiae CBS 107.79 TaxID=1447943 RepID=A0A6A5UK00_9PLEO|nr:HET-domain-containing protein [Bimuria novae-zelandiae CBS 107.79]
MSPIKHDVTHQPRFTCIMPQIKLPDSAVLCERCTPYLPLLLDVSPAAKDRKAQQEWWSATYEKIKPWFIQGLFPERCELCKILNNKFSKYPGFDAANTKISVSSHRPSTYKGLDHHTCLFKACGGDLMLAPVMPAVTADDGEHVNAFTGRPVFQSFNPLLAKIWLAKCHTQHTACKPEYTAKDFQFPFRVIDVQEGRLVDAPPDVRYIALSYVWGGVKQVMLKKSNRRFLEQPGYITSEGLAEATGEYAYVKEEMEAEGRIIPRTIREAIRLCQLINERYLWTDSLCILQDDEIQMDTGAWTNPDKLAQIPKMDIIYGASTLTVIAASGADSNAGLPGVLPTDTRKEQMIGKIGDQFFVSIQYDPMKTFWESTWVSRAWTFQEFLLSKRHMIFLPEQVVFHCRTLAWCEDHSLEYIDEAITYSGCTPAWTSSWQLRPLKIPERSNWAEDVYYPEIFINQFFSSWLQNFLQRRLTVSSDILFAFEGALSASNRLVGAFHHGLPVNYFCECLNWGVGEALGQSYSSTKSPYQGLTKRRPGFPSWSWTGWMWDLPPSESFNLSYIVNSPEKWNRVAVWGVKPTANGQMAPFKIAEPDVAKWERLDVFPPRTFKVGDEWVNSELPKFLDMVKRMTVPSNCLIVKTVIATIHISSEPLNQYSNFNRAYSSGDFTAKRCLGGIGISSDWKEMIEAGLQLQIIVVGNFWRGPDPRWPDRTDEHDPTVKCLVVREVEKGVFERLNTIWAEVSIMKSLEWSPVVAILQ